jgi:8-oxo-dGTP pyrophosphatase MutT (NUDIX family)
MQRVFLFVEIFCKKVFNGMIFRRSFLLSACIMKRQSLLNLLARYRTGDAAERLMVERCTVFIQNNPDCFERSLSEGHITASGWIVNKERKHVLLIHHLKLDRWLQPGGHCDGNPDVLAVAIKECLEETGLQTVPVTADIFDVDIHTIPQRNEVPEHLHYDIRFLLQADINTPLILNKLETKGLEWAPLANMSDYTNERSIIRLCEKTSNQNTRQVIKKPL